MFKRIIFSVIFISSLLLSATIQTAKDTYNAGEQISVTLTQMQNNEDWIGIYPVGTNNEWDNMVSWAWTDGAANVNLQGVPAGEYEARAFFNNSFDTEVFDTFTVNAIALNTTVESAKDTYNAGEQISITLTNMLKNQDWLGIYPVGTNNEWENVVSWTFTDGEDHINIGGIPAGEYEVRAFFNNSFDVEATDTFKIEGIVNQAPTIYEDGEDGNIEGWLVLGDRGAVTNVNNGYNSNNSINVPVVWGAREGQFEYRLWSEYELEFDHENVNQKMLKFEHKGRSACYYYGVKVRTLLGIRLVTWDAYYTHNHWQPLKEVYDNGTVELIFPTPGNVRNEPNWTKHSYDIDKFIKKMEPNNRLLAVQSFYTSGGGQYDNIRLESE